MKERMSRGRWMGVALGVLGLPGLFWPLGLLASCAATHRMADSGPIAECPVCKHNGDLACLCVHVAADTPHCECAGETYYFCSEECREDFLKHPERYVEKREGR